MRASKNQKVTDHSGSTFDSFLEEEESGRKSKRLPLGECGSGRLPKQGGTSIVGRITCYT